jgi:hypothetical protein
MRQRYFLIEPKYSDPDTFCHFIIGSDRVRASIQIYADLWMLNEAAAALTAPSLQEEAPFMDEFEEGDDLFYFYLSVLPHDGGNRCLRFRVFQDWLDDGAPYRADIRFTLSPKEADEFASELKGVRNRYTPLSGKGDHWRESGSGTFIARLQISYY